MMPPVMRAPPNLAVLLHCALLTGFAQQARAQATHEQAPAPTQTPATGTSASVVVDMPAPVLAPFVANYEAHYQGKPAGNATLQVVRERAPQWRVDLGIEGRRGMAGVLGLNVQQSTAFDVIGDAYRPLGQSTVRKGLFLGRKTVGRYDWNAGSARWEGDVKKRHRQPVALQPGDMSGLLINLAIVRDARPDAVLRYRFVEGGRIRDHVYRVSAQPETVAVGELSYTALRVARTNGGNDDTVVWVAQGVPTPVRILQREDGEDAVDLRLIEYK